MKTLFILAALFTLSVNTAHADDMSPGQAVQRIFYSEAGLFNFDPETRKFSYARQACTDKVLLRMGSDAFGWDSIAEQRNVRSYDDAVLLRPVARLIFSRVCLS